MQGTTLVYFRPKTCRRATLNPSHHRPGGGGGSIGLPGPGQPAIAGPLFIVRRTRVSQPSVSVLRTVVSTSVAQLTGRTDAQLCVVPGQSVLVHAIARPYRTLASLSVKSNGHRWHRCERPGVVYPDLRAPGQTRCSSLQRRTWMSSWARRTPSSKSRSGRAGGAPSVSFRAPRSRARATSSTRSAQRSSTLTSTTSLEIAPLGFWLVPRARPRQCARGCRGSGTVRSPVLSSMLLSSATHAVDLSGRSKHGSPELRSTTAGRCGRYDAHPYRSVAESGAGERVDLIRVLMHVLQCAICPCSFGFGLAAGRFDACIHTDAGRRPARIARNLQTISAADRHALYVTFPMAAARLHLQSYYSPRPAAVTYYAPPWIPDPGRGFTLAFRSAD